MVVDDVGVGEVCDVDEGHAAGVETEEEEVAGEGEVGVLGEVGVAKEVYLLDSDGAFSR